MDNSLNKQPTFEKTLKNYKQYIKKIASTLCADEHTFEELVQVGSIRLHYCYQNFDESKGDSFKGYCGVSIRGEMMRFLSNDSRVIRIPHYLSNTGNSESPTMVLTSTVVGEDLLIADTIADEVEDDDLDDAQTMILSVLRNNLSKLKETHQEILKMRYIDDLTFNEMAEILGITKQGVYDKHHIAIKNLKKLYGL